MQESVRLIDDVADASARFSAKEKQSIDRMSDHRQFQSSVRGPQPRYVEWTSTRTYRAVFVPKIENLIYG